MMYMYMVCITEPCSHWSGNEAKLKIYLSIFFTTNGLLHTLSMHTCSMHPPRMHTFCLFLWTPPCTHTFCLFLWTPPCILHAHTPSACSNGHLHASSTHIPSACVICTPACNILYAACLPVAVTNVPIQVRVDGQGNLCPSQKGASNDLTRFVAAEVVEQYDHIMNCSTCSLSGVELTSCSSE